MWRVKTTDEISKRNIAFVPPRANTRITHLNLIHIGWQIFSTGHKSQWKYTHRDKCRVSYLERWDVLGLSCALDLPSQNSVLRSPCQYDLHNTMHHWLADFLSTLQAQTTCAFLNITSCCSMLHHKSWALTNTNKFLQQTLSSDCIEAALTKLVAQKEYKRKTEVASTATSISPSSVASCSTSRGTGKLIASVPPCTRPWTACFRASKCFSATNMGNMQAAHLTGLNKRCVSIRDYLWVLTMTRYRWYDTVQKTSSWTTSWNNTLLSAACNGELFILWLTLPSVEGLRRLAMTEM